MSAAYTQDTLRLQVTTPLGADKLLVRGFTGEEQISGLFRYQLELVSEDKGLDFDAVVGQGATVKLALNDGSDHFFHGVVARFSQEDTNERLTTYYAELRPWLWVLTLAADCRIFQNQSTPDIIKAVFSDLGFTDFRDALTGSYTPREYCVQYNETAFDFVSRLTSSRTRTATTPAPSPTTPTPTPSAPASPTAPATAPPPSSTQTTTPSPTAASSARS